MGTVSVGTSATQINDGSAAIVYLGNTGTQRVLLSNGATIEPGFRTDVRPGGVALTGRTSAGATTLAVDTSGLAPTPGAGDFAPLAQTPITGWRPSVTVTVGQLAFSPAGGELMRRNTSGTTRTNWDSIERGAWTILQRGTGLNVKDFGAIGDGVTDDSAAFSACSAALIATQGASPWETLSNFTSRAVMYVPPGEYLITQPGALLDVQTGSRVNGFQVVGAGKFVTRIRFNPADPGPEGSAYLVRINDRLKFASFSGISFACTVGNASFMHSISSGGSDGHMFRECSWEGSWRYAFHLTGTNTNSEFSWEKCLWFGDYAAVLYIPDAAGGGSDQFLDYDFRECGATLATGNLVDVALGGNINVWGGSYSLDGDGSTAQKLLALRGGDHSSGVCRVLVTGARLELKHDLAQAIYCEWKAGNVAFHSVDMGAMTYLLPATNVTAEFAQPAGPGPNVVFDSCSLPGQHKYHVTNASVGYARRIAYVNSDIYQWPHAGDFVALTADETIINRGAYPPIIFENCRTALANSFKYPVDCVLNWQSNNMGQSRERVLSFQTPYGAPASNETAEVVLPYGAVITKVVFDRPSAGSGYSGTSWSYVITDADAASVASYAPGTAWNAAFHGESTMWKPLTTLNKRTLTLSATGITANDPNSKFVWIHVYYIA